MVPFVRQSPRLTRCGVDDGDAGLRFALRGEISAIGRPWRREAPLPAYSPPAFEGTPSTGTMYVMPERDEIQIARWEAIRSPIGSGLRHMRGGERSQAQLAWELDELGFHISQSMVSRYEQGQGEVPLTLERMVGWALCCDALGSEHLREILELGGYALPWTRGDMTQFDDLLRRYRALSRPDQMVLRRRMLWHLLGLHPRIRKEQWA